VSSDINSKFNVQIISTKNNIRSKGLESKLLEYGLRFQISPGVVPNILNFQAGILHSPIISKLIHHRDLNIGEVGCALAHRLALTNFLNSGHEFGLIFEDDAEVIAEFDFEIIKEILDSDQPRIVVFAWNPGFAIANDQQVLNSRRAIELITPPLTAIAYAVNGPAAKVIVGSNKKINDVADWPIHALNKVTFFCTDYPWVTTNPDEKFSIIGQRTYPIPNSPMGVLVSRVKLMGALITLMLLSKAGKLNFSPKQIVHRLIIQPMLYQYGLNQVDNKSPTNKVALLPSKFKKFGLTPSRWTRS
jgi:GR25 family glycosyltransferase involved in LPS biosynthesis